MYHRPLTNTSSLKIAAAYCTGLLSDQVCNRGLTSQSDLAAEERLASNYKGGCNLYRYLTRGDSFYYKATDLSKQRVTVSTINNREGQESVIRGTGLNQGET